MIKAGYQSDLSQLCDVLGIPAYDQKPGSAWVRSAIDDDRIVWKPCRAPNVGSVPHVLGMTLKDALFLLENDGLKVIVQGPVGGRVKAQSLPPYTKIVSRGAITLQMR